MAIPALKDASTVGQRRGEFIKKMESTADEIKDKFTTYHKQLFRKEASLLELVKKIRIETLNRFDNEIAPKLIQIDKAKDKLLDITSGFSEEFREKQNEAFNSEIDSVLGKSGFQRVIELNWKIGGLNIDKVCVVEANIALNSSTQQALCQELETHFHRPNPVPKPKERSQKIRPYPQEHVRDDILKTNLPDKSKHSRRSPDSTDVQTAVKGKVSHLTSRMKIFPDDSF